MSFKCRFRIIACVIISLGAVGMAICLIGKIADEKKDYNKMLTKTKLVKNSIELYWGKWDESSFSQRRDIIKAQINAPTELSSRAFPYANSVFLSLPELELDAKAKKTKEDVMMEIRVEVPKTLEANYSRAVGMITGAFIMLCVPIAAVVITIYGFLFEGLSGAYSQKPSTNEEETPK